MTKYLTIDIGNSSAKAAVWIDGAMAAPAIWGALTQLDIEHLCALTDGVFDCAAVSCVGNDPNGLTAAAERLSHRLIEVSASTPMPLSLAGYATPGTLGADRIAAMAGAWEMHPGQNLLVVDCGTAITYDRMDSTGCFVGGNIAPGIGLRLRSLHAFTAKLPLVATDPHAEVWGKSTSQAMQAGALYGAVAEIEFYQKKSPEGTQVVLTGGRGKDLCPLLTFPVTSEPDLVLRGLKYIIEYNENK